MSFNYGSKVYPVYEFITDPEQPDFRYKVNIATGEAVRETLQYVEDGARIIPPKQLKGLQQKTEMEDEKKLRRAALSPLGRDYFFVDRLHDFRNMKNQTLARLVYLATYLPGGSLLGSNRLHITRQRPLTKDDLTNELGLKSRHARDEFLKDAADYLTVCTDGTLLLNRDVFKRGHLSKEYQELQRAYFEGIRKLYRATPTNKHRLLGLVFKLIPFVNIEFNIVCENPDETELDAVRPLSIKQICEIVGYDFSEIYRLKDELFQIRFPVGGHLELFCALVQWGAKAEQTRMFVNPHVFYCGSNYECVELLGRFCVE